MVATPDFPGYHSGGAAPAGWFSTARDVAADTPVEPLGLAARVFAANHADVSALTDRIIAYAVALGGQLRSHMEDGVVA
jgi:hypothetical protein